MKVLRRRIIGTLFLFGEILYVFTSTQHRNIHKHPPVHHQRNVPKNQDLNINATFTMQNFTNLQKSTNLVQTKFHEHKFKRQRSSSINYSVNEVLSKNSQILLIENDTKTRKKAEKLPIKGPKRNTRRFRFSDKVILNVRQHAAKSVKLDCTVKGVSKKRNLVIKWLKDGIPISSDIKK